MWCSDTSTSIDAFGPVPGEAISGDGMQQGMLDVGPLCTGGLTVGVGGGGLAGSPKRCALCLMSFCLVFALRAIHFCRRNCLTSYRRCSLMTFRLGLSHSPTDQVSLRGRRAGCPVPPDV